MKTIYDYNSTMKILGYSEVAGIIAPGGVASDSFRDVCSAHRAAKKNNIFDNGFDFFALGYIYGKRAERAKRKEKGAANNGQTPTTSNYIIR